MPHAIVSLDLEDHARHYETIRPNWPPSRDPFVESARARARATFEAFERSEEAEALGGVSHVPVFVMREACLRHGMTVDTMTPEVFQAVSELFVEADTMAAYAHWLEVAHEDLEAFFRFLARSGFDHAEGCLGVLARLAPVRKRRYERLIEASITPLSEEEARRFATRASCITSAPCSRVEPS